MKIALVHDYLIQDGGAERVFLSFHDLFPDAPIFTLFYEPSKTHPGFLNARVHTSSLDRLWFSRTHYQWYLALMPQAIESFDLSGFDVILSSSSTFAKGVIAPPDGTHLCYCHNATRFLWHDRHGYVNDLPQPRIIKQMLPLFLHGLRQWDQLAGQRPDLLLTNSQTSRERIQRYYRRDSLVVHPPVDVETIPFSTTPGLFWVAGGRLVGYKRFDLTVEAFNRLGLPLKIFGEGPEEKRLRDLAKPNIEWLGRVSDTVKHFLYRDAIAFLHPQIEDWGITAVEAMAAGRPVIAYDKGGARETVIDGVTGQFFHEQTADALEQTIRAFDASRFSPSHIRSHAMQFSKQQFQDRIKTVVENAYRDHHASIQAKK